MKDDTISRAAALNALGERPVVWSDNDDYTLGERNQYDMDRLAIETVPSAQLAQDLTKGCTDTISRAAVVDAIEGVDWYHQNQHGEMVHGENSAEHQAWYKAEDIYAAIEALPSAQPDKWDDTVYRKAVEMLLAHFVPEERYAEAVDGLRRLPSAQPGQRNARVFQGIVVEYPSISAYPEYDGKPYFSIKYTENGQEFIGYGTYKPEVLSEYLKEYFMPPAQQTTLTADDIETIRIHLSAFKEKLCNQGRWTEAAEYEKLIQRLTGDGGQDG